MPIMIKLTSQSGNSTYINASIIKQIDKYQDSTLIIFTDNTTCTVKEEQGAVNALIGLAISKFLYSGR